MPGQKLSQQSVVTRSSPLYVQQVSFIAPVHIGKSFDENELQCLIKCRIRRQQMLVNNSNRAESKKNTLLFHFRFSFQENFMTFQVTGRDC